MYVWERRSSAVLRSGEKKTGRKNYETWLQKLDRCNQLPLCESSCKTWQNVELLRYVTENKKQSTICRKEITKQPPNDGLVTADSMLRSGCRSPRWSFAEPGSEEEQTSTKSLPTSGCSTQVGRRFGLYVIKVKLEQKNSVGHLGSTSFAWRIINHERSTGLCSANAIFLIVIMKLFIGVSSG